MIERIVWSYHKSRSIASNLKVDHSLDVRLESGLELLEAELLLRVEPVGSSKLSAIELLGRDEDIADDLNDTIGSNTVLYANAREGVDLDVNQTTVSSNVNGQGVVLESSGKINVPVTLGNTVMALGLDESITVQDVVGDSLY